MIAQGRLRHCWFGEYSARIALKFASPEAALEAQAVELTDWRIAEETPQILVTSAAKGELKAIIAHLVRLGADPKKIDSIAHSIDYGDPFQIEVLPRADAAQVPLPLEGSTVKRIKRTRKKSYAQVLFEEVVKRNEALNHGAPATTR